ADTARRSVSGVSSDEELLNVTRSQQAYAAAAKIATAADEMLSTIIQMQHTQKAYQIQQQISSGNRAVRPSDDPSSYQLREQLTLRSQKLATDQQFLGGQKDRLDNYDATVGTSVDQIRQARSSVQQASNAPADSNQMAAFKD
ncbi:hypothetical protein OY671_011231, partial [Metschnikowia pulcherrima]